MPTNKSPAWRHWFTDYYWLVLELALQADCPREYLTTVWRKTQIGRGKPLKAAEFDNAVRAADGYTMNGQDPDTLAMKLDRAEWCVNNNIPPAFARPEGWEWTERELAIIRDSRANGVEPVFAEVGASGIDIVAGPRTEVDDGVCDQLAA